MLPLGLLLFLGAGAVGVAVCLADANGAASSLTAFGQTYDMTTLGVFLIGTVVGVVGLTGVSLMVAGVQAGRDRRRAHKLEAREVRSENESLAEENARLRSQVSEAHVVDAGDPYPVEPTDTVPARGRHAFRK